MTRVPVLRLYERPDCHLCEEVRKQLQAMLASGSSFTLEQVDIERDDALLRRYLERIPVIELEGELVSELGLDADGLRAMLATVSG
jgi:hypothetical protein